MKEMSKIDSYIDRMDKVDAMLHELLVKTETQKAILSKEMEMLNQQSKTIIGTRKISQQLLNELRSEPQEKELK